VDNRARGERRNGELIFARQRQQRFKTTVGKLRVKVCLFGGAQLDRVSSQITLGNIADPGKRGGTARNGEEKGFLLDLLFLMEVESTFYR
jgi:hypothetical protein